MANFELANKIKLNNPYSNIDAYYGPYTGLTHAVESVPFVIRSVGLTVGIIEEEHIIEYWWRNGVSDDDLVVKSNALNSIPVYNDIDLIPPSTDNSIPEDVLLVSNENTTTITPSEREILLNAIYDLQNEIALIKRSFTDHMDCGSLLNDKMIIEGNNDDIEEEEPLWASETGIPADVYSGTTVESEPETPNILKVTHLTIKSGSSDDLVSVIGYLLPDELVWAYDTKRMYIKQRDGSLFWLNSGTGGGIITGGTTGDTTGQTDIDMNNLESITFVTPNDVRYNVTINDNGELEIINERVETPPDISSIITTGNYTGLMPSLYLPKLYINSLYCGGLDTEEPSPDKYQYCSHNFVELSNLNNQDISLNNLALKYSINGTTWESIKLKGIIKAQSTFLVRGAKCSVLEANTTRIKVNTYDMEWTDNNDDLIKFSTIKSKFLLVYEGTGETTPIAQPYVQVPDTATAYCIPGYIDMVGLNIAGGSQATAIDGYENKQLAQLVPSNRMYLKYFTMDPVSQATKSIGARSNATDWVWIELNKDLQPNIEAYTPKASFENKNLFFDKTKLDEETPNMATVTFGRNAHTTRCFNWVSKYYYDEFLWYRLSGETQWIGIESFKDDDERINYTNSFYNRIRVVATDGTPYTAHKLIISGLTAGTYEYKCGRVGHESEICKFTVRAYSTDDFSFVQTTDQQGFNWCEYEVWRKSAEYIKDNANPLFVVNTGDMTQNGNRISEWLDYFNAGKSLFNGSDTTTGDTFNGVEQMNVIGNNDLCPNDYEALGNGSDLSKINSINFLFFYTYEMDPDNLPIITTTGGTSYFIPSLYSFDYNDAHFIMVNSEISENTEDYLYEGLDVYAFMKTWCETDIAKTDKKWKIAACHEMPFTIITDALITSYEANNNVVRGGSRINTVVKTGSPYWFSRFLEQYGVRLCVGGHKHTYSQSYPLVENVSGDTLYTMKPKIQVLDVDYNNNQSFYDAKALTNLCELEIVTGITAPVYVMCQATGYKQTSNKELPAENIPWLKNYFPSSLSTGTPVVNAGQKYPFYIKWTITSNQIIGDVVKINNIMTAGKFNINTPNIEEPIGINGNGTSNEQIIIDL